MFIGPSATCAVNGSTPTRTVASRDTETSRSACIAMTDGSHSGQRTACSVNRNSKDLDVSWRTAWRSSFNAIARDVSHETGSTGVFIAARMYSGT